MSEEEKKKCAGKLYECRGKPVYIAKGIDGPGSCFNGTLWCEECMGVDYEKGNPYLKKISDESEVQHGTIENTQRSA